MYEFIAAEEKHLDQIVPLIASTGYWEAGLKRNHLNLPTHEFIREYVATPNLPFTTIVVRKNDKKNVLGLLTSGTKRELESSLIDYSEHIPLEIGQLFKNLFTFEIANSYHVSFLALNKACRGQGIGIGLMHLAESKWKNSQLDTLSLYTFSCQTNAIKLYLKAGMLVTKVFSVDESIPCPCVLYFEKNKKTENLQNYFETQAYQELIF